MPNTTPPIRAERRSTSLTDEDITRLLAAIDKSEAARLEAIGYDISTAQERGEIREDHSFVRGLRKGTGKAKSIGFGAFVLAVLGLVGHWVVVGIEMALQTGLRGLGKVP